MFPRTHSEFQRLWPLMSSPLKAPLAHHCTLIEALDFPSCPSCWDDFFLDSHDSSSWNHISQSHVCLASFISLSEVGLLPVELPPMIGPHGLLSPVAWLDELPLPLVDPYVLLLLGCSLKFFLGSLPGSPESGSLVFDPLLLPSSPTNLSMIA